MIIAITVLPNLLGFIHMFAGIFDLFVHLINLQQLQKMDSLLNIRMPIKGYRISMSVQKCNFSWFSLF